MNDATPTEQEAVKLLWRAKNPESQAPGPSEAEAAVLLQQVRDRAIAIENASLELLKKQMRVRPTGGGPSKARLAALVVMIIVVAGLLLLGASLFIH